MSAGTVAYTHPDTGAEMTTPVTGGACKLQWKADWAMRWTALGVDYEMAGKDLSGLSNCLRALPKRWARKPRGLQL